MSKQIPAGTNSMKNSVFPSNGSIMDTPNRIPDSSVKSVDNLIPLAFIP